MRVAIDEDVEVHAHFVADLAQGLHAFLDCAVRNARWAVLDGRLVKGPDF